MKLPFNLFNKNSDEGSEYYLALLLTDEKIGAVILQQTLGKLRIVGRNEEPLIAPLELLSLEELIDLVDKTVSKAEEILPPDVESHKTVFGVKDNWVEADTKKIKKDYLSKLKKLCDSLDLSPIGFMVVTEAISNLLQDEEGAPLSAILAEIGKKSVILTLFRGGKVAERIDGPLEETAAATVDSLLKHFTTAVLPARIILYDAKDSDKLAQKFIGHQWSKSLPFLHVPQIVALPEGTDARAVVFGAASQMGLEVLGMEPTMPQSAVKSEVTLSEKEADDEKEVSDDKKVLENESEVPESLDDKEKPETTEPEDEKTASTITSDNFGFVANQDIVDISPKKSLDTHESKSHEVDLEQDKTDENIQAFAKASEEEQEDTRDEESKQGAYGAALMTNAKSLMSNLRIPRFNLPLGSGRKNLIIPIAIIIAVIVLISGISYFYTYNTKANIVLTVKPKIVAQTEEIIFSSKAPSDFSENTIATKTIEAVIKGELATDTTGKKDVGNKAKGTVTIYNNGSTTAKLESGTQIKSSNNLIFLLDKDVSVASASGDIFSGTKPGTADVAITAKEIGTESNLPSGTKFSIGSNASLAAKNDSAFSGGSKKQVQVVSKNDIEKLKKDLPKSLQAKANEEIGKKVGGDETILPLILVISLDDQKFDKAIDDEAKKVKLTANVKFGGQAYQKDDLNDFAKSRLKSKYSQDISFADETISTSVKDPIEKKNNQIEATLVVSAGLLPNINKEEVVKNAQSKSLKDTQDMLSGLPQVVKAEVNFSPNVLFLPSLFPNLPKQINIEVKPE